MRTTNVKKRLMIGPRPGAVRHVLLTVIVGLGSTALVIGCWTSAERHVVVYTALDREFADPIFEAFQAETGIRVLPKYDTESTKTVQLVTAIMAEAGRPRCDLFWNNEILNTLRLDSRGFLDSYGSKWADSFPAQYRSPTGTWHGFAARARVLVVNTDLVRQEDRPTSIHDLVSERWKGKVGVAKPLFGTTATHAAVLFAYWGDEKAQEFFRRLRANAQVLSGNRQVAEGVARGQLTFGLTDTDDAISVWEKGFPVAIVYPDQQEGGMGTLFIPNTLALIRGSRNGTFARQLMDYLLSPDVEAQLAQGPSAQIPLGRNVAIKPRVETPETVKAMVVDFPRAAAKWETAALFLRDEFASAR
jgi:iron(III) transport system substrate-binding protein